MFFRTANNRKFIPSWLWILLVALPISFLIRWLIWWFFCPSNERTSAVEIEAPRSESIPIQLHKDDFSRLKGVGPKTADVIHSAGIFTFEQLGLMDPGELAQLLKDKSLPATNIAFWQKQAALAAAQDWDELNKIQK
jgi:hypothetical protein